MGKSGALGPGVAVRIEFDTGRDSKDLHHCRDVETWTLRRYHVHSGLSIERAFYGYFKFTLLDGGSIK